MYPVEKLIFVRDFCGFLCSRGVSKAHVGFLYLRNQKSDARNSNVPKTCRRYNRTKIYEFVCSAFNLISLPYVKLKAPIFSSVLRTLCGLHNSYQFLALTDTYSLF